MIANIAQSQCFALRLRRVVLASVHFVPNQRLSKDIDMR